eukprot:760835-Hanusia_phi.AAC.1
MDFGFRTSRQLVSNEEPSEVSHLRRSLYDLQQDLFKEKELRQDSDRELVKALSLLKKVVVLEDPNDSRQNNFSAQSQYKSTEQERELRQLQATLQACTCKLEAVEGELERKCNSYNHLEETMIQLNKLYEQEQKQRNSLETDYKLVKSSKVDLEEQLFVARSKCEDSNAQLAELREEMQEIQDMLSQAVKDSQERDAELKKKMRAYKSELRSKNSKIEECLEENESLLSKINAMKEEEETARKKHKKELERLRAEMSKASSKHTEELDDCLVRLKDEEERRKKLQLTVEGLKGSEERKRVMEEEMKDLSATLRNKDRELISFQESSARQTKLEVESVVSRMNLEHMVFLQEEWAKATEGLNVLVSSCGMR